MKSREYRVKIITDEFGEDTYFPQKKFFFFFWLKMGNCCYTMRQAIGVIERERLRGE